jgi:polar amino acid transport system substrate-binding protein
MKTGTVGIMSALFVIFGLSFSFFAVAQVTLHFSERPPYVYIKDGQLSGLIGSPAEAAFKAAGVQYTLALTPTERQIRMIKNNVGLDCTASGALKTEEREAFGKFSKPIYQDKARIAITSSKNTKVRDGSTIESALGDKAINLLVKQGYSYGKALDDLIEKMQPTKIVVTAENIQMLRMIRAERADLMFISQEEADSVIVAAGINAADIRKIHFSNAPNGETRYIFCSKRVPDEIINKLNSAIK